MKHPGGRVAVLGGGIAGLTAAWALSEPGWQDRFDSITVYQRGWRLGGKAASSRGVHDRIEEHGLHIWLGSYENAFHLLRSCYAEIDRPTTDPDSPIQSWRDALVPADNPGLADRLGGDWLTWMGTHPTDGTLPGEATGTGRDLSVVSFIERALLLLTSFVDSVPAAPGDLTLSASPNPPPPTPSDAAAVVQRAAVAILLAVTAAGQEPVTAPAALVEEALAAVRAVVDYETRADHRRGWLLASLLTATVRGILADNLVTHPAGFRNINDEDFCDWICRHGAHPDVRESPMIRGLYDLVFGYVDADPDRPGVAAGLMVFLVGQVLFGYRGALFWKMTAGMGDVVIAPLYQVLRDRGVRFEFFHRLDALHLDAARTHIESITMGRQAALDESVSEYQPLVRAGGLWVFPDAPQACQLAGPTTTDLESHFGDRSDADRVTLTRGVHFDHVVLAVSLGMVPVVAAELLADRRDWRDMTANVRTVATQAFQLWLRPTEPELGWPFPGATISAYRRPFETWASMPQTLWAEGWPAADRPGTVAYFCGSLAAEWPTRIPADEYVARYEREVRSAANRHIRDNLALFFPNAFGDRGFDWDLLTGRYISVNVDPSDRYVQSVPGSDRHRLRPDESGYDNLVLAGDWTDCGMNAGCIEAAVMSGLEAANAVLGRNRFHRVRGYWLP